MDKFLINARHVIPDDQALELAGKIRTLHELDDVTLLTGTIRLNNLD